MQLIGLLGHQGVGKNYLAEVILPQILTKENTVVLAFADHFKVDCISKYGANYDKVFGEKDYETRRLLQIAGTEEGRNKYGSDIWIRTLEIWINILNSRGVERFIISDVRFQNEVNWIKSLNGIIIKIDAPIRFNQRLERETNNNLEKINEIKNHASEVNIDKISNYNICVNNDPGQDIILQLKNFFSNKI
jgi:hypothetical protein